MPTLTMRRHAPAAPVNATRRRIWEPGLLTLTLAIAVLDATASIIRHVNFRTGFDLALFDQIVWRYSQFVAPYSSIKGMNLLGDHFHPLVAVLAPLYWIWSDPRTLLVAQAALVAASIVPVFLFAQSRLGRGPAYLLATAYAVFWGLQVGVLFEFHELAFAPLLIALCILFADRRRWGWFFLCIGLLLLAKEDLSFFVVAFGIYLLTRRDWMRGALLIGMGIGWYALATDLLIPHFAHGTPYGFWSYDQLGRSPLSSLWTVIHSPWKLFQVGFSPGEKAWTMLALFGAFLFLSLASRLIILALPLLAERFLSTNSNYWSIHGHYSMAISPVLAMAAAAGLASLLSALAPARRRPAALAAATLVLGLNLGLTEFASTDSAISALTHPSFYRPPPWHAGVAGALSRIPANASLATESNILPHASERSVVALVNPNSIGVGQYMLVNLVSLDCCGLTGNTDFHQLGSVIDRQLPGLTPVYYSQGWLLATRAAPGQAASSGVLSPLAGGPAAALRRTSAAWRRAEEAGLKRLGACGQLYLGHSPAAPGCYGRALRGLDRSQQRLARLLNGLASQLAGGCRDLGLTAASATTRLTRDLDRLASAGASGSSRALIAAGRRYQVQESTLDLDGALQRFTILCTSRAI